MKIVSVAGIVLAVLGIASLFVPIPHTESHGMKVGDMSVGIQTTDRERVSPIVSAVLIAGGILMVAAGARGQRAES